MRYCIVIRVYCCSAIILIKHTDIRKSANFTRCFISVDMRMKQTYHRD